MCIHTGEKTQDYDSCERCEKLFSKFLTLKASDTSIVTHIGEKRSSHLLYL